MARKKMVTRSMYTTDIEAIVFNDETNKTGNIKETLAGNLTEETALKALKKKYADDEKITPVKVLSVSATSTLYGIEEDEFIKIAKKLENRNNKVSEDAEEEYETSEE